jgi:hypothetical protein
MTEPGMEMLAQTTAEADADECPSSDEKPVREVFVPSAEGLTIFPHRV